MSTTKFENLKEKIGRIAKGRDDAKKDFLIILACHKGFVMPDSISTSLKEFLKKYGEERFNEVKNYLIEEGKGFSFIPYFWLFEIKSVIKRENIDKSLKII